MNYKTMLVGVLLAGSMQNAWGMQTCAPSALPVQNDLAQIIAAIKTLNLNVENMNEQLSDRMTKMEQKIERLEEKVKSTQSSSGNYYNLDHIGRAVDEIKLKVDSIGCKVERIK